MGLAARGQRVRATCRVFQPKPLARTLLLPLRVLMAHASLLSLYACLAPLSPLRQERESVTTPRPVRLLERSIFSDRMVFVRAVCEAKWMDVSYGGGGGG